VRSGDQRVELGASIAADAVRNAAAQVGVFDDGAGRAV